MKHGTTVRLQGVTNYIIKAYEDIDNAVENLKYLRENLDEFNESFR